MPLSDIIGGNILDDMQLTLETQRGFLLPVYTYTVVLPKTLWKHFNADNLVKLPFKVKDYGSVDKKRELWVEFIEPTQKIWG